MSDSTYLDDATLEKRVNLATEVILTSGTIVADDIVRGWWDIPDPADDMQRTVTILALVIILGGVEGAPMEDVLAAWDDERLLHAAIKAVLTAVANIRADMAEGA